MFFLPKLTRTTKVLGVINAICLSVVFLVAAIYIPTFSLATYTNHYANFDTAEVIGISDADLLAVTERLVGYIRGRYPDLHIYATVQDEYRPFFTQREIDHMVDVLLLFNVVRWLAVVAVVTLIATAVYAHQKYAQHWFYKAHFITGFVVMVVGGGLALLFSNDFVHHFHRFHDIFFFFDDQQLWLLNPQYDMLINMVPYSFFINIFTQVGLIFGGLTVASTALFGVLFWRSRSHL